MSYFSLKKVLTYFIMIERYRALRDISAIITELDIWSPPYSEFTRRERESGEAQPCDEVENIQLQRGAAGL